MAHFAFLLLSHLNLVQAGVISELEAFALVSWWWQVVNDNDWQRQRQWSWGGCRDNDKDNNDEKIMTKLNQAGVISELEAFALVRIY